MKILCFIFKIKLFCLAVFLSPYFTTFSLKIIYILGAFYVKIGQFLSTRPDICGAKRSQVLTALQYSNKIDNTIEINDIIPKTLAENINLSTLEPIKSASIAQVYRSQLKNGKWICIKLVKPIQKYKLIQDNARFLKVAEFLSRFKCLWRFNIYQIALNVSSTLKQELDMKQEAQNIAEFRYRTRKDPNISAPSVYFEYSNEDLITMSWIEGKTLLEICKDNHLVQHDKIVKLLLDSHLKQVYMDNVFHADIHHSNIIFGDDGILYFLDFGSYSKISRPDANAMLEIIHAFLTKNYRRMAVIHKDISYISKEVNIDEFEAECKKIGDEYLSRDQFSIGEIFSSLMAVSKKFGMEIQPQLVLLQKTMVMIEGVIKSISPNSNIWNLSRPMIHEIYHRLFISKLFLEIKSMRSVKDFLNFLTNFLQCTK